MLDYTWVANQACATTNPMRSQETALHRLCEQGNALNAFVRKDTYNAFGEKPSIIFNCKSSVHKELFLFPTLHQLYHYWPLIFSHVSISPVKLSRLPALTGSLSQCRLFWERIQNCMSSQAWACSQPTQPYSLSTMWHALLWTEVSVSVSSSDTLPGRCEALQGLTYYSVPEGGKYAEGWTWEPFIHLLVYAVSANVHTVNINNHKIREYV